MRDIVESLHRVGRGLDVRRRSVLERVLNVYLYVGLAMGVAGLFFYFFRQAIVGRSFMDQLPVLFTLSGFAVASLSYAMLRFRRLRTYAPLARQTRREYDVDEYRSFVRSWRDIELGLRDFTAATFSSNFGVTESAWTR